jgi:hypothetical protein
MDRESSQVFCNCCKATREWLSFKPIGYQSFTGTGINLPPFELRNCPCGATMAHPDDKKKLEAALKE